MTTKISVSNIIVYQWLWKPVVRMGMTTDVLVTNNRNCLLWKPVVRMGMTTFKESTIASIAIMLWKPVVRMGMTTKLQ